MAISTVILKPTKRCNADCRYCCAPPDDAPLWGVDDFVTIFDRLAPHLTSEATLIWHGGEPMLLGPRFYEECFSYARARLPNVRFSMQSNMLLYDKRWTPVLRDVMGGSVSTSYDPDARERTLKGSTAAYTKRFFRKLNELLDDGFRPLVIATFDQAALSYAPAFYDLSASFGARAFNIRLNYRYPAGRAAGFGAVVTPRAYGQMLIDLYNRWIADAPDFNITPLDQMLAKVLGADVARCPWSKGCGGRFLGIEPNGDVYNCGEFADLQDKSYSFGNIFQDPLPALFASPPAVHVRRRQTQVPADCISCRHFGECEGGCARDAVLYRGDIGGKFFYCETWKMVFDRIKESVANGEAARVMSRFDYARPLVRVAS